MSQETKENLENTTLKRQYNEYIDREEVGKEKIDMVNKSLTAGIRTTNSSMKKFTKINVL